MPLLALSVMLLCSLDAALSSPDQWLAQMRYSRSTSDSKCYSFTDGPLSFCSRSGYNTTFKYPEELTDSILKGVAMYVQQVVSTFDNCSMDAIVGESLMCSFFIPHCSGGKRIYPCKRVCGEFLKKCLHRIPANFADYLIAICHTLPDKNGDRECFEPPNFKTNDSVKGPLDRGCQELILPACKNLGVSNHTLLSVAFQKTLYGFAYKKPYLAGNVDPGFPPNVQEVLKKYPKCQENIKKLYCGERFPPCFKEEGKGFYSICKSVCSEILRDCPNFFRDDLREAEFCAILGTGNTSHGYCKRTEWPAPFSWIRYVSEEAWQSTKEAPTESTKSKGSKTWVIVVAVLAAFVVVGMIIFVALYMKWRRGSLTSGYKKQENDTITLENSVDL
ncbi:unnamed protein product [Pocillopora meandrina]|uniref:FZ domain-containing protein n=1 Tax=Pocillopora meandrina TaxID=46732 RepID=A0AAU9XJQ1_9CNID|nr:unnamed protein product [Pocillopora meandrina]